MILINRLITGTLKYILKMAFPILAVAQLGLMAYGMYTSYQGNKKQQDASNDEAQQQKVAYDYNAKVAEYNAQASIDQANFDAIRIRRRNEKAAGSMNAQAAGLGLLAGGGTFQDIKFDSLVQGELDVMARQYQGAIESNRYSQESALQSYYGQTALTRGANQSSALKTQGQADLLGNAINMASVFAKYSGPSSASKTSNPGF